MPTARFDTRPTDRVVKIHPIPCPRIWGTLRVPEDPEYTPYPELRIIAIRVVYRHLPRLLRQSQIPNVDLLRAHRRHSYNQHRTHRYTILVRHIYPVLFGRAPISVPTGFVPITNDSKIRTHLPAWPSRTYGHPDKIGHHSYRPPRPSPKPPPTQNQPLSSPSFLNSTRRNDNRPGSSPANPIAHAP